MSAQVGFYEANPSPLRYNKMVTDAYDVVIDKLKRGGTAESVASHEEAIKKLVAGRPNTLGG
jgi:hypothetical protein